jgi:hypothetical protein
MSVFLGLDLLQERNARMISACRTDARHAVAAKIFVPLGLRLNVNGAIAVRTSECIRFERTRADLLEPHAVEIDARRNWAGNESVPTRLAQITAPKS